MPSIQTDPQGTFILADAANIVGPNCQEIRTRQRIARAERDLVESSTAEQCSIALDKLKHARSQLSKGDA